MRRALLTLLLFGCNTGAELDVVAEDVTGAAVVGAQVACEGDGQRLAAVLLNQGGGAVRLGGARVPTPPATSALRLEDVTIDGRAAEVELTRVRFVDPGGFERTTTVVLDRSGVSCGALPVGPWEPRCNFTPCGSGDERCGVERGCCGAGELCAGIVAGAALQQECVAPEGCSCSPREVCYQGECVPRLLGPVDPDDDLVQRYAASVSRLLDADGGRLAPRVPLAWVLSSSGAGVQVLGGGPVTRFEPVEEAIATSLLPPYGRASLLRDVATLPDEGPVLAWGLASGSTADLAGRAPHLFAVLDSKAITETDDGAFARAACETDGVYLRIPPDSAALDQLASVGLPAAARSFMVLDVRFDPEPAPGARLKGTLVVDVEATTSGGRPDEPEVAADFDLVLGGEGGTR